MNKFTLYNNSDDFSILGDSQFFWFDASDQGAVLRAFTAIESQFDLYAIIFSQVDVTMNEKIAEKLGGLGAQGFLDLTKQRISSEKIKRNNESYFVDFIQIKCNQIRCIDFLLKTSNNLGVSTFLFTAQKNCDMFVIKNFKQDFIDYWNSIDSLRFISNNIIHRDLVHENYLLLLKLQIDRRQLCLFTLQSEYTLKIITVVGCHLNLILNNNFRCEVKTLEDNYYYLKTR